MAGITPTATIPTTPIKALPAKTAAAIHAGPPRDHLAVAFITVIVELYTLLNIEILFVHLSIAVVLFGREVIETIVSVER